MKITIAENIRALRKERKLTQEQLAEAMGVTVGAVSRWESGSTAPDLSIITELAEFFEVSVDVLLGYNLQSNNLRSLLAHIRELRNAKRFEEACVETEKMLLRYPNSFDAVFGAAVVYSMRGIEQNSKKTTKRSLELFERALELENQNTDTHINKWTIRNNIASVLQLSGQTDRALEEMKKNNADSLNDGKIGFILASVKKQPDEAFPYLTSALIQLVTDTMHIVAGLYNAYSIKKDYRAAFDVSMWMINMLEGLKIPGKLSYLDMLTVQMYTTCVISLALLGDIDTAEVYLKKAYESALAFDKTPTYDFSNMKFFVSKEHPTAFDDFGETAVEGIKKQLYENADELTDVIKLWEKICNQ